MYEVVKQEGEWKCEEVEAKIYRLLLVLYHFSLIRNTSQEASYWVMVSFMLIIPEIISLL